MIEMYTDGAYHPVSGRGGWGAVLVENGGQRSFSGAVDKNVTSNRMEITAALEGIARTLPGSEIKVFTDSQYLFGCMAKGWQRRANRDLWQSLDDIVRERKVHWQWIERNIDNDFHRKAHNMANGLLRQEEAMPVTTPETVGDKQELPAGAELTHLDETGRPRMVDITAKQDTMREAVARGSVSMSAATFAQLKKGDLPKGDVLTVAQLAGIMAAKKTPELIPLCHPVLIGDISVELSLADETGTIEITSRVKSTGKTGVEMEALTAIAVAALTVYDMCKAIDRSMRIENIRLVKKSGGKSGTIVLE